MGNSPLIKGPYPASGTPRIGKTEVHY